MPSQGIAWHLDSHHHNWRVETKKKSGMNRLHIWMLKSRGNKTCDWDFDVVNETLPLLVCKSTCIPMASVDGGLDSRDLQCNVWIALCSPGRVLPSLVSPGPGWKTGLMDMEGPLGRERFRIMGLLWIISSPFYNVFTRLYSLDSLAIFHSLQQCIIMGRFQASL